MAYFNHAFTKIFLGNHDDKQEAYQGNTLTQAGIDKGFITTVHKDHNPAVMARIATSDLQSYGMGPGVYGFFDKNYNIVQYNDISGCCPLYLVGASLLTNDKIGQYHGGYHESNKSKLINPKYVQKVYKVESCTPQQSVVSVGVTPYTGNGTTVGAIATTANLTAGTNYTTDGTYYNVPLNGGTGTGALATVTVAGNVVTDITITNAGHGYTVNDTLTVDTTAVPNTGDDATIDVDTVVGGTGCCFSFYCGETYYLRVDVKGSPTLRALNHQAYQNIAAYTGCCPTDTPTVVDPTTVYLTWAKAIVENNYLKNFIAPVVYDYTGVAWYAPGTTVTMDGTNTPVTSAQWWTAADGTDNYAASVQGQAWTDATPCEAGMRLFGAFVETKFGNCSFQQTDFFEKEPVRIYASMVDYNGDPCIFEGVCVVREECLGVQGMGFGEQVVRDLILSERYLQNFFHSDIRIREITQGSDYLNLVDRNALYTRYCILHSVPRFNNPTGVFDNDRYMLEIITTGTSTSLETFLTTWLAACADCVSLEIEGCTPCDMLPDDNLEQQNPN